MRYNPMAGKSPAFLPAVRLLPIVQRRGGAAMGFPRHVGQPSRGFAGVAEGGRLNRMGRKYFIAAVQCPVNDNRLTTMMS